MSETAKGLAYDIALCWCKEQHQTCDKAEEIIPMIDAVLETFESRLAEKERVIERLRGAVRDLDTLNHELRRTIDADHWYASDLDRAIEIAKSALQEGEGTK